MLMYSCHVCKICTDKINFNSSNTTTSPGFVQEAELPYHEYVGPDPSIDDMRKIVSIEKLRPSIPASWKNDEV